MNKFRVIKQYIKYGLQFKYPLCCVLHFSFIDTKRIVKYNMKHKTELKILKENGVKYIPCPVCYLKFKHLTQK
jgi:hypothetical protein